MRVRVAKRVTARGEAVWAIEVKRWWLPFWTRVDYWAHKPTAIEKATALKQPDITEI